MPLATALLQTPLVLLIRKLQPNLDDHRESKLYLSKRIGAELLRTHQTERMMESGLETPARLFIE